MVCHGRTSPKAYDFSYTTVHGIENQGISGHLEVTNEMDATCKRRIKKRREKKNLTTERA
jgi:CelD/BcsL family acetyltransferase involved in cellulose biosynthesis